MHICDGPIATKFHFEAKKLKVIRPALGSHLNSLTKNNFGSHKTENNSIQTMAVRQWIGFCDLSYLLHSLATLTTIDLTRSRLDECTAYLNGGLQKTTTSMRTIFLFRARKSGREKMRRRWIKALHRTSYYYMSGVAYAADTFVSYVCIYRTYDFPSTPIGRNMCTNEALERRAYIRAPELLRQRQQRQWVERTDINTIA